MKYAPILDRLAPLGSAKWEIHFAAQEMARAGRNIIDLTIGNPDVPAPAELIETAHKAMLAGRTTYSSGQGEPNLRKALALRYSTRTGRAVTPEQVLCFPGTQTALYAVMMGIAEPGAEVLIGDPMYATYEAVVAASGARLVPVPLRPDLGFRLSAVDLAARVTERTRAILLNSPHNPTGAVLGAEDIAAIGKLASKHDLWILSDEVYEELVFDGVRFVSPFDLEELAERSIVVASISKSHAVPGFRTGWAVGSKELAARLLPLSETMLFGNQPFIADMTARAVAAPSATAAGMRARFAARARYLSDRFAQETALVVHRPDAGMFALVDISATGMADPTYARSLLEETGVAVMPGSSFGAALAGWVRLALTVRDDRFRSACDHIVAHATRTRDRRIG